MEGLLLAEALQPLEGRFPLARGAWRFPDEHTAVLPLASAVDGSRAVWIFSRPPSPRLALMPDVPPEAPAHTPFQEQLAARVAGPLEGARQRGLDRVVEIDFGLQAGFVSQPGVTLVVELTGRNANLVLLNDERTILGVERVVLSDRNRYRELRPGLAYRPPPPYDKLDPRTAGAAALEEALQGRRLDQIRNVVDGIGPELTRALAAAAELPASTRLEGEALTRALTALARVTREPAAWLVRAGGLPGLEAQRRADRRQRAVHALQGVYRRNLDVADRRLEDVERALRRASEAASLRAEADLLMAYAAGVPEGAERATLTAFDGEPVELTLDPRLDAFANADRRYQRARRLERRAERAAEGRARARADRDAARRALEGLEGLDDDELERRAKALEAERDRRRRPSGPGLRFTGPHGFEVVVGRNARENDAVTFALGRSLDVWLHVQGFAGAHVLIRAGGAEVPFDTLLFAARLAAGFSPARDSDNVPVDYALRKNVWKVKGQAPGRVHFSRQKTVYVTPARDAETARTDLP